MSNLSSLPEEHADYIRAAVNDDMSEFWLEEDKYLLFQDSIGIEGGTYEDFLPSVDIFFEVEDEEQVREEINSLLEELDWFIYDGIDNIQDGGRGRWVAYFANPEIRKEYRNQV